MIHGNITITFPYEGVCYLLSVEANNDNLPYYLATAFCEVIRKSCANAELVINEMKNELTEDESNE